MYQLIRKNANILVSSIVVSLLLAMTYTYKYNPGSSSHLVVARFAILLLISLIVGICISPDRDQIAEFLYKYRWIIGFVLIVAGVVLNINGSSLAAWGGYYGYSDTDVIFGAVRPIRSDEWAVNTPFAISQEYTNYSWYSDIINGTKTDVTVIYGQPVLNVISILFRPFLDGFLLWGSARGLAFFWCARFVVLWLVSFDFSMLITNKKKMISVLVATMISLSPLVQWWFAINGLVEMLIFGGMAVLALDRYMRIDDTKQRVGNLLLIVWSAGCYVLTFYPALMVSLAYFYVLVALWIIIKNRRKVSLSKRDFIQIVVAVLIFLVCMGYFFLKTWDIVTIVMNTAYPGKRVSTGGGLLDHLFMSWGNLFFPLKESGMPHNACESAVMFDLFPVGIMLAICGMVQNKKVDILSLLMIGGGIFFGIYCFVGFPSILAKLTFMSYSTSSRAITAFGMCNLVLLGRSISVYEVEGKKRTKFMMALIYAVLVAGSTYKVYGEYITKKDAVVLATLSFICLFLLLNIKHYRNLAVAVLSLVVVFAGATVNPVQLGLARVKDNPVAVAVQKVVQDDPEAVWATEMITFPMNNFLIMQGARQVTSTHVYPDMNLWKKLDPDGQYEEIYNRYEHVNLTLIDQGEKKDVFELPYGDQININVDIDELSEIMNVKYVFTSRNLSGYKSDSHEMKFISSAGSFKIYEVTSFE